MEENKRRTVSIYPIAILNFYRSNKEIINIQQEEFKEWLKMNYLADSGKGRFIATKDAVDDGYMINKKQVVIDYDEQDFDCYATYSAYITQKGQEYVLDYFEKQKEK